MIVRIKWLQLAGHIWCLENRWIARKKLFDIIGGKWPKEKPRKRWFDEVGEDAEKLLGIINWGEKLWIENFGEAARGRLIPNIGLSCHRKKEESSIFIFLFL